MNDIFNGRGPTWANACVGNNGAPGYQEYAKGYSVAANLLLDSVIEKGHLSRLVDELIYPICFNMRHSIELRLKMTVESLQQLAFYRDALPDFDLKQSHDVGVIWSYIIENAKALDARYELFLEQVNSAIESIAAVDPTGQTFRYPVNNENKKHLTEIGVINHFVLKSEFSLLEQKLDELNRFNELLLEEYSFGVYTKTLSRMQLFELAKSLPPRSLWAEYDIKVIKMEQMKKYQISSNEFGRAVRKMECNYELSRVLKFERSLLGIDLGQLEQFFEYWDELHGVENINLALADIPVEKMVVIPSYETIKAYGEKVAKIRQECSAILKNDNCIAGIEALFYLRHVSDYSEAYRSIFEDKVLAVSRDEEELYDRLLHMLKKANGFEMIMVSLYWLGFSDIAEVFIEKYNVSDQHGWLQRCRDRSLFMKPECLQYT